MKIIFLDIDGTLTIPLEPPTQLAIDAVRKARANGHKVLVCTGRNKPIIGKEILDIGFDGIVASAGAYVEVEDKIIFDDQMNEETVQKYLKIFHDNGVFCRIENKDGIYIDQEMEDMLKDKSLVTANSELVRMQKEFEKSLGIQNYAQYKHNGAYKLCFTCTDIKQLDEPISLLKNEFNFVIHEYATSSGVYNGEIIRKGFDKGDGMRKVCEYYGESMDNTIAFGDSMNDMEMIKAANISVAMENGCNELKAAADYICESVEKAGIYSGFEMLHII